MALLVSSAAIEIAFMVKSNNFLACECVCAGVAMCECVCVYYYYMAHQIAVASCNLRITKT